MPIAAQPQMAVRTGHGSCDNPTEATTLTAISAVIFLVSANYDMATSYIIGRVENGDYGLAIAYSSVLILVMLLAISLVQFLVGERRLGRRERRGGAADLASGAQPA